MAFRFDQPWLMLLLPVAAALVIWLDRKYRARKRSLKRDVSLAVRLIVVALMTLALAAPSVVTTAGKAARWILLDVSDSAASSRAAMEQRITDGLANAQGEERLGVIAYGKGAMVETPLSDSASFSGVHAAVGGSASDLDSALRLASVLLPNGVGGVTVLSDGMSSVSRSTLNLLRASGVKVDTVSYEANDDSDAQISQLIVPTKVYEGQSLSIQAIIDANDAFDGTLALYQNGELTATLDITLQKGENRFAFTDLASQTGLVRYEARLSSSGDGRAQNNRAAAYTQVLGAPNVLLVTNSDITQSLLGQTGMKLTSIMPTDLPSNSAGYLPYDAIVLDNVAYDAAGEQSWQALKAAVQTLGRGLCVFGGDSSYALGGYRGTALEELLPVSIDVRNKQRIPALSLVLAIDKSGSMSMGRFGTSLIDVAKEAAIQSVEVLSERDNIGVIGFDDTAKWVVPFQTATDKSAVESLIGTLRADGGTAFYSPLSEAYRVLSTSQTPQKHVIFLSDGQPADTGYQDIALAMSKAGITLTTVAVGSDADQQTMRLLATLGGGRMYSAGEFDDLPKIFTKETMMVSGSYVQNRSFTPVVTEDSTLTDFEGFPTLDGYLTTAEKGMSTVSMISDTDEPVLAWWQTGAGKALAWTSDARGAWTQGYLLWEQAPAFFGAMIAKVLPATEHGGTASAAVTDDRLSISFTTDEAVMEGAATATLVAPDGTETKLTLTQTGEKLFEGETTISEQGAYSIRVDQTTDGAVSASAECGAVLGFPAEYDLRAEGDISFLTLASQTGGQALGDSDGLYQSSVQIAQDSRSLRNALCIAALCLWLIGLALDKLPWELAVEKLLGRQHEKPRRETIVQSAKPERKPKTANEVKKKDSLKQAAQTADALLTATRARRGQKQ